MEYHSLNEPDVDNRNPGDRAPRPRFDESKYENIEIEIDMLMGSTKEKDVYRPRKSKPSPCYCGGHPTGIHKAKGRMKKPWNNSHKRNM